MVHLGQLTQLTMREVKWRADLLPEAPGGAMSANLVTSLDNLIVLVFFLTVKLGLRLCMPI